ncbi:hypothetical protein CSUB01_02223 [Colletotrichum sublineola]|uniref:Uncharacterized protein n=1 Tax=Colletotrichum sublineola TaxID=1173701 RepID=A0A066X2Y2_COLSU|nr:hypothetical protein CSUB01_02223 [Colletotrichum sublineola]
MTAFMALLCGHYAAWGTHTPKEDTEDIWRDSGVLGRTAPRLSVLPPPAASFFAKTVEGLCMANLISPTHLRPQIAGLENDGPYPSPNQSRNEAFWCTLLLDHYGESNATGSIDGFHRLPDAHDEERMAQTFASKGARLNFPPKDAVDEAWVDVLRSSRSH